MVMHINSGERMLDVLPHDENRGSRKARGNRKALGDVTNQQRVPGKQSFKKSVETRPSNVSFMPNRASSPVWKAQPLESLSSPTVPTPKNVQQNKAPTPRNPAPEWRASSVQTPLKSTQRPVQEEAEDSDDYEEGSNLYPGHPSYEPMRVTVKNTFIELLDDPCTPERMGVKTGPMAASCPGKVMGEAERQAYQEARENAMEAQALFAGRDREEAEITCFDVTTSVGSLLHRACLCKPCAWFHHPKGCQRGIRCEFCHSCPAGEIKRRKKEKTQLIRKRRVDVVGPRPAREMPDNPYPICDPRDVTNQLRYMVPHATPVVPADFNPTQFTALHAQAKPFTPGSFGSPASYATETFPADSFQQPYAPASFTQSPSGPYLQMEPMSQMTPSNGGTYGSFEYWTG